MPTGFEPIWNASCRVLVLGSMPSVKSLEQNEYYAHPRNAFWPIMRQLLTGQQPPAHGHGDYAARCGMLLESGIALWDVCFSCEREASSDASIRSEVPNDIAGLAARMPLKCILLNGGTASALYRRHIALDIPCLRLPSTSPAYTLAYARKLEAWREALISGGISVK